MQRLLFLLIIVILIAVGVLTAAPLFVDLEGYKKQLITTIKSATGLKVEINGTIDVTFLPVPKITVTHLLVENPPGAKSASLLNVETLEVSPSIKSLVGGKISFNNIKLIHPVLEIEQLGSGQSNLEALKESYGLEANSMLAGANIPKGFTVYNGSFAYTSGDSRIVIDYINADISVDSLQGPFYFNGDFSKNEHVINFKGSIGEFAEGAKSSINITSNSINLELDGTFSDKAINGIFNTNINNLTKFSTSFFESGSMLSKIKSNERLELKGAFSISRNTADFKDISIISESINGNINLSGASDSSNKISWKSNVNISNIDLDKLSTKEEQSEQESAEIDYYASTMDSTNLSDFKFSLPRSLSLLLKLTIEEILYNKNKISNVIIDTDISNGEAEIKSISVDFPGESKVTFSGEIENNGIRPILTGKINGAGRNLKKALMWLIPSISFIPDSEFQEFLFTSDLSISPQKISLNNIYSSFDKTLINGLISIRTWGGLPTIKTDLKIDRVDFDKYNFTTKLDEWVRNLIKNIGKQSLEASWLRLLNIKYDISLDGKDLIFNGKYIKNALLNLEISPGIFNVQRFFLNSDTAVARGNAGINLLTEKPTFTVNLQSKGFDTSLLNISNKKPAKTRGNWSWSREPFNLLGLEKLTGKINISLSNLKTSTALFDKINFEAQLGNDSILTIDKLNAKAFGGDIDVKGSVGVTTIAPFLSVSVSASKLNLDAFLSMFNKNNTTKGQFVFGGTFKTFGKSPYEWMNEMQMNSNFSGRYLTFKGFNIDSIVKKSRKIYSVIDMESIVKKEMSSGKTMFTSAEGKITAENGLLQAKDFKISTRTTNGLFAGNMNLRNLATNSIIKLGYMASKKRTVTLGLQAKGPLYNLNLDLDTTQLESYITDKASR